MTNPLSAMLTRGENAKAEFIQTLQFFGECSANEARAVMTLYLKHKLAKIDYGIGRVSVKHGAFLDKQVIRNAINNSVGAE